MKMKTAVSVEATWKKEAVHSNRKPGYQQTKITADKDTCYRKMSGGSHQLKGEKLNTAYFSFVWTLLLLVKVITFKMKGDEELDAGLPPFGF